MKTLVQIIGNYQHSQIEKGKTGYIDGYVMGGDNRPYAVVVSGEIIDMVPITGFMRVIGKQSEREETPNELASRLGLPPIGRM